MKSYPEILYTLLGKTVTITVDRLMGSAHPQHNDIIYPVNYGFIDEFDAPDGEKQNAYILGVDKPLKVFTGTVTAIIHRENDTEDKLVVTSPEMKYNQATIMEAVHFQEQYFQTSIVCQHEKSCGVIVCRKNTDAIEFLLLFQHRSKTWSFPKGHTVAFESELQTALREVQEEIGIKVAVIEGFKEHITYPISEKSDKEVILFVAQIDESISIQNEEISEFLWVDKKKAAELLVHKEYVAILENAENTVNRINLKIIVQ